MRVKRAAFAVAFSAVLLAVLPAGMSAHDIPNDATIRAYIKPDGQRLHFLIRVPMASINDVEWPLQKDGNLDLTHVESALHDAGTLWIGDEVDMFEGSTKLGYPDVASVRLSLEGDTSFDSYDEAMAHVTGERLPETMKLLNTQGMLDVLFDYHIQSERSDFSVHPRFERLALRVTTILRFILPSGAVRAFDYEGGDPGLVRLDPEWYQAVWQFVQIGFFHVLDSTEVLLALLCLVLPFRRFGELASIAGAFLTAQAVTLLASAYGMAPERLWFPPLIATLVAVAIFYVAIEDVIGYGGPAGPGRTKLRRRTRTAYGIGLIFGFGIAFTLSTVLQFAGTHTLASVLSFNIGVALGQIFTLALLAPALDLLFQFVVDEQMGTIILSALAAHAAWHWMVDRYGDLRKFPLEWPVIDALFLAGAMRWAMVAVLLAAAAWLFGVLRPLVTRDSLFPTEPSQSSRP